MNNYQLTYRSAQGTTISQIVKAHSITMAAHIGETRTRDDRTLKGFAVVKVALTTAK